MASCFTFFSCRWFRCNVLWNGSNLQNFIQGHRSTDLHYVKVTDTISEELKNSVNVGTIKFDLQKGYYVTTDTGEQIFVSVDGDSGSSSDNTPSTSDTSSDSNTSYSAGALAKSLTIDKIQAGKSVNLKLTMTARKDIKRALNLKNSVNVTASVIETANDNSGNANGGDGGNANDGTTEGKDDTSTEKKNDTTEEKSDATTENTSNATDTAKGALAQATSAEDNTTKGGNSNAGNTANNTSKIVALPVDEAMHNDTEIISIGKYAVHYPQMSVSMTADKTNTGTTNKDGVIGIGKTAGIYKAGDLAKFTITVNQKRAV